MIDDAYNGQHCPSCRRLRSVCTCTEPTPWTDILSFTEKDPTSFTVGQRRANGTCRVLVEEGYVTLSFRRGVFVLNRAALLGALGVMPQIEELKETLEKQYEEINSLRDAISDDSEI